MKYRIFLAAAFCLGVAGAAANPIFKGGHPTGAGGGGGGTAFACDAGGSGVCADHLSGQTFVRWTDAATGATGANFRYRLYRSTSPITSGNYASATLVASYVFNNSGQLFGGDPDAGGAGFNQANRQSNSSPNVMAKTPDVQTGSGALRTLAYGSGLQVYTALGTATAYYAVVSTNTSDASPSYIGSVGPIAESAATPGAILYAHRTTGYGNITTSTAGLPVVFAPHASSGNGGCASNCGQGDYYEWFGDTTQGWQDGRATAIDVLKDGVAGTRYPSLTNSLLVGNRDTVWSPDGTSSLETLHFAMGLTPNALVGPANKVYPVTSNAIKKQLAWVVSHYGADANKVHLTGVSMGAWAGILTGLHQPDVFASLWLTYPIFRLNLHSCTFWPAYSWDVWPFTATVAAPTCTLGSTASALQFADNSSYANYVDATVYIPAATALGTDLPFTAWTIGKDDVNTGATTFAEEIAGLTAFQNGHQGHAFAFVMGNHDMSGLGALDADSGAPDALAYSKASFALNLPFIATDHSSIDDNPGTGARDAAGIYDGDSVGCINCGFSWNVGTDNSGTVAWTIGNGWMARPATVSPQTTLTSNVLSSGTASFTVTSGAVFQSTAGGAQNAYFKIGTGSTAEIIEANFSGNTVTPVGGTRGSLGTTAQAHSSGVAITQYISQPTGPNGGAVSSMTVNMTPRRLQNFHPANGATVTCLITGQATQTPTVTAGHFTLTGVTINTGANTVVSCS